MSALAAGRAKKRGGLWVSQRRFILSVTIPMILYGAIGLFTVGWALVLAFFDYSPGRAGGPILGLGGSNPFVGLEHFANMVNGVSREATQFRISLKNTLIFALAVLPLNLAITLPLATLIESVGGAVQDRLPGHLLPAGDYLVGRGGPDVGLPVRSAARPVQRRHPPLWRYPGRLAIRPARPVPWRVGGHVGGHRGLPVAGLWLQPGDLYRGPAGDSQGVQGRGADRRRQSPGRCSARSRCRSCAPRCSLCA